MAKPRRRKSTAKNVAERRKRQSLNGRCVGSRCKSQPLAGLNRHGTPHLYCEKHWLRSLAVVHLGDASCWKDLLAQFNAQNRRCYFSDIPLILGVNAELDHFWPKSRYRDGAKSIDNLVWVDRAINRMKGDWFPWEWHDIMKRILEVRDSKSKVWGKELEIATKQNGDTK